MIGRLLVALLVANAIVFAWGRGWLGLPPGGEREPQMIEQQHDADRLRSVPLSRLEDRAAANAVGRATIRGEPGRRNPSASAVAPSEPAAPSSATAAPAPPTETQESPSAPAADVPPATDAPGTLGSVAGERSGEIVASICRAYGPTDEERAARLREALEASAANVDMQRSELGASYLVYVPPSATFADAQQRLADLRRIGRDDAFLIQEGQYRLGISLGVFRAESVARAFATQVAEAGEPEVQVAARPPIQVRVRLQARWSEPGAESIATMLGAQFDLPVRECR